MNKLSKAVICYTILAVVALGFDKLYALFGHGVSSSWMSSMYLVLLLSGTIVFFFLWIFTPKITSLKGYRLFFNIYSSGIAVFVNGMLLQGIIDIAGGTSDIVQWFFYTAYGLWGIGVIMLGVLIWLYRG